MATDFIDYVTELLLPMGHIRCKRMFGGTGIYINDLFCAIVVADTLYFKGDALNEAEFRAEDCPQFTYLKEGVEFAMRYYQVPEQALDNSNEMLRWARLGLAAALRKSAGTKSKERAGKSR
jgi:DNA transformation protein